MEIAISEARAKARPSLRAAARYWIAVAGVLIACCIAVFAGKASLDPGDVFAILLSRLPFFDISPWWPVSYETILMEIRLPRVAMGVLVGAGLAVSGATYQGLFRNPLADPYLVGVAAGAGLGAVLAIILPLPSALYALGAIQIFAFIAALLTVGLVYSLARVERTTPITTLLLAGVAVGALANAITSFLMYDHGEKTAIIYAWMLGGFNVTSWQQVASVAPYVLISIVVISLLGRLANVLQLDDEQAKSLGVDVERVKCVLVLFASLSTAASVSATGLIGFVGLVVPHVVRMLWGPDYRSLIPLSALVGASFLVLADAAARMAPGSQDIPVGVITAFFGAPFFLYLLRQQKRSVF